MSHNRRISWCANPWLFKYNTSETSNSLDVSEIDAASNNGVDDARALIERSSLAPVQGHYRIFILDEAHQLTTQSQNALLKCIEEPPPM